MRDRLASDWVHDLEARHALERRVARHLDQHRHVRLDRTSTASFNDLDYLTTIGDVSVPIELKCKWQPYVGWSRHAPGLPEVDLLILDELALRKLIGAGPRSHLLVMDKPGRRWVVLGVPELVLSPKTRVTRLIRRRTPRHKSKLLVDLGVGLPATCLDAAIDIVVERIHTFDDQWNAVEPWPMPDPHREVS